MKGWKRGALAGVGGVAALVAIAVGVGATLPVEHSATVSGRVAADPERVWAVITAPEDFAAWRAAVERVEILPARDGLPVWREHAPTGAMTLQVTRMEAPRVLVTRIADEGLPFGGTWTYRLEPADGGTTLTITEDGEIYNPFFRFVARFVIGYDGTMRAYLEALQERMGGR